ncbi:hypothetical protein [Burkholderia cepacia]|uniref:Uncharacterized protein n=1 Tax=Burkholderia cepacia TaxID=292 RepID=A0ABM6NVI5_BURCE|nr:hypothetical protein [Burkholderia cepacia]AIO25960.1 hypothetical protein DM41_2933 [Burkholderia cepacia ATCC 25416]ALK18480.1 hypothetical protein APZ15_12055 [Burkholderia cepacia ATCC 25416]ASE96048.1 hypothetical protein CEQ23_22240 [Burkholderia cepacia]ATF78949.1 hypothetical protein CO711_17015 [Burkholderia cepacia]MCA8466914.1 hypothetical protein [Burkholderia cepacia]
MTSNNDLRRPDQLHPFLRITKEEIDSAARNLGLLRSMSGEEIETELSKLIDEVIRHLEASHAITMAHPFVV